MSATIDDVYNLLLVVQKMVTRDNVIPVSATGAALKSAGATLTSNNTFKLGLSSVPSVLSAASSENVSVIIQSLDLTGQTAVIAIHGTDFNHANDIGKITTVDQLSFVAAPANSRCQ